MPITAEQQAILDECDRGSAAMRRRREASNRSHSTPFFAAAATKPPMAAEDYTEQFLGELAARAGIAKTDDPDAILAALDRKLGPAATRPQTRTPAAAQAQPSGQAAADAKFDAQLASWGSWFGDQRGGLYEYAS